ncbi:sensor domain-containing diguanylate cyclase [Litoribrevibacter albus]|uniref:diguanylate cyclase n=1 Tax=Litoribrevibacter albus TaxID=1473156 RepID=A0AA37W7W4_9GAMM|nr:diguanylate cyclase [Litoribrevibacter albus]GLQ31873.1 hypothetical protein GCM10007876_23520 [Litoribrevibacter albus]
MKLKHLLILVFVVLSAIPLFVGLQYLNHYYGEHHRALFTEHLASLSLIAKQRILGVVDRIEDSTSLIASRTQMRISLDEWNTTRSDKQKKKLTKIINDAKYGLDHLKDIQIFDPNGELVASTPVQPPIQPLDLSVGNSSQLRLQLENEQLVLRKVSPLLLNHDLVGYLRLTFMANFVTDLVRDRTGLGETGEWLIAVRDSNGDALFAVPLKYDYRASFKRTVEQTRQEVPIVQALRGNELIMNNALDYMGEPVLASTRYLKELDWGLVAKINEEEVNRLISQNTSFIYTLASIILIVAIVVGIILSVYISSPIERLKFHVDKVSKGSFENFPSSKGWQEVKDLSSHLTNIVHTLKDLNENLQAKVDERTQELCQSNKQLEELSLKDPLTNLYNRRFFNERLSEEVQRAHRYSTPLACVMLDIDHFKSINDKWGHDVGDDVLVGLSNYLVETVRESDILARLGGEEFCILLPVCSESSALRFLERIKTDISNLEFVCENQMFHVTCSFGIAVLNEQLCNPGALLKAADQALYSAKHAGRNRVVSYSKDSEIS